MRVAKIKYKRGHECALLFSIFSTAFYTLQGSAVYFEELKILLLLAAPLAVLAIVKRIKVTITQKVLWLIVFGTFVLLSAMHTQDSRVLMALLAVGIGFTYEPQEIIVAVFIIKLVTFLTAILAGGYNHINGVALHGGVLILLYIAVRDKSGGIRVRDLIGCVLAYAILSIRTQSGSIIICGGFTILALMLKKMKFFRRLLLSKIFHFIFLILLSINVICADLFYKKLPWGLSKILYVLDDFVTHRIELAAYSLKHFSVSWLGGNVEYDLQSFSSGGYFNLDSGYMWLLQGGGIVLTVIFILGTIIMLTYFSKKEKYIMIVVAVTIALWALNEDLLISLGSNFLFFYIGFALKESYENRKAIT